MAWQAEVGVHLRGLKSAKDTVDLFKVFFFALKVLETTAVLKVVSCLEESIKLSVESPIRSHPHPQPFLMAFGGSGHAGRSRGGLASPAQEGRGLYEAIHAAGLHLVISHQCPWGSVRRLQIQCGTLINKLIRKSSMN